jgi:hypothetical protein
LKIRVPLIAGVVFFLSLTGLCIPAYFSEKNRNLLLVHPAEIGSPRIDVQKIEDFIEGEFLLTYEIPGADRADLIHAVYPVTVIGTNSAYAQVMGFVMTRGSFFSKQAWTGKLKQAVLNEKAAFTIFGSDRIEGNRFRMRNDTWLVTGVIRDGDEDNPKIYIPSSVRGGEVASFIALLSPSFDEAYVKTSLKNLGIREGNFDFYNLGTQCRMLWERPLAALFLFVSLFLLSFLRPLAGKCKGVLALLKGELKHRYTREILLGNSGRTVLQGMLLCLSFILIPVLSVITLLRLTEICLPWQDVPSLATLSHELFYPLLTNMRNWELVSRLIFILSLSILAAFLVCLNMCLKRWTKHET